MSWRRVARILTSSSRMASSSTTAVPEPTAERTGEIAGNLASIRSRIAAATPSSSKQARLVAVSKLKPASDILAAFRPTTSSPTASDPEPGQLHFGENYAQELEEKARVLPREIRWHFIGGLQTNKCKSIGAIPNLWAVETVDSVKKAKALQKARSGLEEGVRSGNKVRIYIQVNTSSEEAKSGVPLPPISEEAGAGGGEEELVELARTVRSDEECPDLVLAGLMTIGSLAESSDASCANADFSRLIRARTWLAKRLEIEDEKELELSMGMSADFEEACRMGSDNVRIGSSVFGQRMDKEEAKQVRQSEGFANR